MDHQYSIYAGLLVLSALLNLRQPNMLALVAVTALYLLVFPSVLDIMFPAAEDIPQTWMWYIFLAVVELSFAISAIALCCGAASYGMVALSSWIIISHVMGAFAYVSDGPFYDIYPIAQISGEVCQIVLTIVLSGPCMWIMTALAGKKKKRSRGDNGNKYRLAPGAV